MYTMDFLSEINYLILSYLNDDRLDSLKKNCILAENIIFHE